MFVAAKPSEKKWWHSKESEYVTKAPAYIEKLRKLARADPTPQDLEEIENELYLASSDRSAAIMWSTYIEMGLERLLESKLRDDLNGDDRRRIFESNGPLGSFSSKILLERFAFSYMHILRLRGSWRTPVA